MKRLTRNSIEKIAERVLRAYKALPEIQGDELYRIAPEILLAKLLGLTLEYAHLSLDGSILGLTSFNEVEVQVFDQTDMETYLCLDGKTIVVEQDLLSDVSQRGRRNFTIAHECSHQIFKMLYPMEYGAGTKASSIHFYTTNSEKKKQISNWEEWQANTLASALLLPEELIKKGMFLFGLGERIPCLNRIYSQETYSRISTLADFLGVSRKALAIRMRQLNLLDKEYLDDPFAILEVTREAYA